MNSSNYLLSETSQILEADRGDAAQQLAHAFADSGLSAAEARLLQALSTGSTNKAIARQLHKSEFTVRNQLSKAFRKIGVSNRTEAANWLLKLMHLPPA